MPTRSVGQVKPGPTQTTHASTGSWPLLCTDQTAGPRCVITPLAHDSPCSAFGPRQACLSPLNLSSDAKFVASYEETQTSPVAGSSKQKRNLWSAGLNSRKVNEPCKGLKALPCSAISHKSASPLLLFAFWSYSLNVCFAHCPGLICPHSTPGTFLFSIGSACYFSQSHRLCTQP